MPSNVLNPTGKQYIVSSVKAQYLPGHGLEEHFVIHMEGVNILAVNYGAPGACPFPRQLKLVSYVFFGQLHLFLVCSLNKAQFQNFSTCFVVIYILIVLRSLLFAQGDF